MPRAATGQVVCDDRRKTPVFALRFRAYGKRQYVTLGTAEDGWSRQRAEEELQNVLADVRRGIWQAPQHEPAPSPLPDDPTFHQFASDWWKAKREELDEDTQTDYQWQLTNHLLPFFARHRLSQITVAEVDRYRQSKVAEAAKIAATPIAQRRVIEGVDRRGQTYRRREQPLSAASINKTLTRLGQILDVADEYGMIQRNPLRVNPRNRKLKAPKPTAVWLDRADQLEALLDAASELDNRARPDRRHVARRAMIATLAFGGLRIGELVALRWRDVDLAAGRLWIADAKTDAGRRYVELLPALREILAAHKMGCEDTAPEALTFAARGGRPLGRDNIRSRVFEPALALANTRRVEAGLTPLPERLTMHKLRHSCCSLLFVCGYELPRVMAMLGHADKDVTLRIYAHASDASEAERRALRELVGVPAAQTAAHSEAIVWAAMGSSDHGSVLHAEHGSA